MAFKHIKVSKERFSSPNQNNPLSLGERCFDRAVRVKHISEYTFEAAVIIKLHSFHIGTF